MSRRLRLEEEKLRQLKEAEEEEEVDKLKLQLERIYSPIVWRRTATGFRIQDLKESYYKDVTEMFKEHYIPNEVLCKNTEMIKDEVSVDSFLRRLVILLKESFSIIALDETQEPNVVCGVLVLQAVHKVDYGRVFSRVQLAKGEAMNKCVQLLSYINRKVDVFAKFSCDDFLRYYGLCILPEYRHKGLGYHLMSCGLDVARSAGLPVVMGVFSSYAIQKLAKKIGMEMLFEINYVEWRDADREMIFDDPGAGNYSCGLMAGRVPPPPPLPQPSKPKEAVEDVKKPKVTRAEKKAAAKKAKRK